MIEPVTLQSTEQKIIDLYKQGESPDRIVRTLIISYGLVISVLRAHYLLPPKEEEAKRDCRLIIRLSKAGLTAAEIARKLAVDHEFVLKTIETNRVAEAARKTTEVPDHLRVVSTNVGSPATRPFTFTLDPPKPKALDVKLALYIFGDMLKGKQPADVAKWRIVTTSQITSLFSIIGIGKKEVKTIRRLAKCRDTIVCQQLFSNGYTIREIASYLQLPESAVRLNLDLPVSNLPYPNDHALIEQLIDLETQINQRVQEYGFKCCGKYQVSKTYITNFLRGSPRKIPFKGDKLKSKLADPVKVLAIATNLKKEIEAGNKLKVIAIRYHISVRLIHRYLEATGTSVKTLRQSISDQRSIAEKNRIAQLKRLYRSLENGKAVMETTGHSIQVMKHLQKKASIFKNTRIQDRIKKIYLKGNTIKQIANDFLCSCTAISKILGRKLIAGNHKQHRKQRASQYKQLLQAGRSLQEIAGTHKISVTTVRNYLEKYGNVYIPAFRKTKAQKVKAALRRGWSKETILRKGIASQATINRCRRELGL
ncbi:hypothetical protein [Chitinophaga sp. OAE865]|uniref:hypothetical protein n=1 Tax=Chitinophaga sp. OAE865 TaxID=2817898 RepID=UPI001AE272B0